MMSGFSVQMKPVELESLECLIARVYVWVCMWCKTFI